MMGDRLCKMDLPATALDRLTVFKGVLLLVVCSLLMSFIFTALNDGTIRKSTAALLFREATIVSKEPPVCTGNLLARRQYRFAKKTNRKLFDIGSRLMLTSKSGACRLLHFTAERVVTCLDALHNESNSYSNNNTKTNSDGSIKSMLHFVFLGDSRIRHQFFNFVRLIPDFDQERRPINISAYFHGDVDITSKILKLKISFQWRPLINETVLKTLRDWATNETERPYFVFLSMAVHHMMKENGGSPYIYQENLMKLAPILGQLANVTRVVWLNQYPSVDSNAWVHEINCIIYSETIQSYNKVIRRILENEDYSQIRIWDSSNPLAEEYVRGCAILKRDEQFDIDGRLYLFKDVAYFDCDDYIHTGYSALSQATQLLFKDICQ